MAWILGEENATKAKQAENYQEETPFLIVLGKTEQLSP
jgi:hypothetical protein